MFTFFQIGPVTRKNSRNAVPTARATRFFGLRISRNQLICAILLSIVAVTKSYADNLPNFSELVETEGDAVVKISVVTEAARSGSSGIPGLDLDQIPENYRRFFENLPEQPGNRGRQGAGFGSGFIIDETGYVITNAHVVDGAVDIRVGLQDKRELRATLVGSDKASDIAVLKVDANNLPVVKIGDSDNIKVGEWVLAIGSPFGFEHTATQGIVSALSRSLPDDTYVPFIQTDVAVNPGNSGGPLFNTDGEVIGVNSQIYSRSGGYQGLSFSIPINVAMSIAEQLRETGYATRGWLGVRIQPVDLALAESFGLSKPGGALISEVTESSPAEKAGLEVGDIILTFNGKNVPTSSALPPIVGVVKPGTAVPTEIQRNGEMKTIMVTIEPLAADIQNAKAFTEQGRDSSSLGAVVAAVDRDQLKARGLDNGVVVTEVAPDGAAVEAGIIAGDVIVSFNRSKVESVRQLEDLVADAPVGEALPLLIHREQSPIFLAITLAGSNN